MKNAFEVELKGNRISIVSYIFRYLGLRRDFLIQNPTENVKYNRGLYEMYE
jgi:hypothetical protein